MSGFDPGAVRFGPDGLVAGIVQDVADGRVLMVGHLDGEALRATLESGLVHFHSRSRGRLWKKGETSGNVLRLRDVALDCDGDALLLSVEPAGPTCHTGARSCFDRDAGEGGTAQGFAWLERLWSTVAARAADRPAGSYTARLLAGGTDAVARKVAEEAIEIVLAAKADERAGAAERPATRGQLAGEAADFLYHLLVLLAERDLAPAAVIAELRTRQRA